MSEETEEIREERQRDREQQLHAQHLAQAGDDDKGPETTRYISEEEADGPVRGLDWMLSKTASTTNLEDERVEGDEWQIEIAAMLSRAAYPPPYGLTGSWRAWAHDDLDAALPAIDELEDVELEGFKQRGKDARHRSKGGWGVETSTRDTKESIVRDDRETNSSGGLLSRLRGGD